MKKLLTILLLFICISGCTKSETVIEEPVMEEYTAKYVSYSDLDVVNAIIGSEMTILDEKCENEVYKVLDDSIGIYESDYQDMHWIINSCKDLGIDISGTYTEDETVPEAGNPVYYCTDKIKISRFAYNGVQYSICVEDEEHYKENEFVEIVNSYISDMAKNSYEKVTSLVGLYYEQSGQGSMQISLAGSDSLYITISMPRDEKEYDCWSMVAHRYGSRIVYGSSEHYLENIETNESVAVNDGIGGYFEISNDEIRWTGSLNSQTSGYVFHS
ncbi:MAG: hypothetical protein Q4D13_04310 [Erysipelotrichaceae bacterium]|nr:hypothetical protein [Erysipelotrichaceae bacterium]